MGGFGSGKRVGQTETRPVVEDFLKIDILDFNRQGLLIPGTVFKNIYSKNGNDIASVSIIVATKSLQIEHNCNQTSRQQEVQLTRTLCHYGGSRTWLVCGECGSKRNDLYLGPEGHWACRQCLGLSYKTQRLNPHLRHSYMAEKIKEKKLNISSGQRTMASEKPFRMWPSTHIKILEQVLTHEKQSHEILMKSFKKFLNKSDDPAILPGNYDPEPLRCQDA